MSIEWINKELLTGGIVDLAAAASDAAEANRDLQSAAQALADKPATPRLDAAIHRAEQFHGTTATDSNDKADPSVATLADVAQELRPARGA